MDAKEWLIEQGFSENTAYLDCVTKEGFGYPLELLMERYANYKTRDFQAKILDFRVKMPLYTYLTIRDKYDEHFNITTERNGRK